MATLCPTNVTHIESVP